MRTVADRVDAIGERFDACIASADKRARGGERAVLLGARRDVDAPSDLSVGDKVKDKATGDTGKIDEIRAGRISVKWSDGPDKGRSSWVHHERLAK